MLVGRLSGLHTSATLFFARPVDHTDGANPGHGSQHGASKRILFPLGLDKSGVFFHPVYP